MKLWHPKSTFASTNPVVYHLSRRVTSAGHEGAMVGGQGQGHDVARVPVEHRHLLACLHLDEKEFTFLDKYVLCMYKITFGFYVNFSRKKKPHSLIESSEF